ncbi:hypothetical protein SAMD00023353_1101920 [Rosellinia necatrix]|uniref:DUF4238 domain-containing protein n=1 Tax=Rosellinia necatrix TaxID=77044 RepID=A0A1S7UMR7_ROSNE|nr:hypothetical protein SAMD00023353_1101920 [Rosellinia necatrix]
MAGPAHSASLGPEYQHFVPQFMLRNFAHRYTGPQRTKKGKKKENGNMYRGELVVHNVNIKVEPMVIEETKVSRILGQYDMYQDTTQPTAQQRQIETMFGKLENHTSTIFRKIVKAFEAGDPNVWVTRDERNSIRKFLFILKYRGSTFHQRFHHESAEEYDCNDKEQIQAYMKEKGFKRPVDVWFHGLKTIMNLKMDTETWEQELLGNMYETDAKWFIMHTQMMYMAICTPSEAGNEFILTGNSYNVFEGPNTYTLNPLTGKHEESGWTNFHEFAPLSPKLMIVLRSSLLPVPEEDSDPEIKAWRDARRKEAVDDWYGTSQQSRLADLPISKARNSYSQVVNGQIHFNPGEDGRQLRSHKFCFSFFPVGTGHVNMINHIFFENAHRCANIVFGSKDSFTKTLEAYMTDTSTLGKTVGGDSQDARRKTLVGLAELMKSLGSTAEPVWSEEPSMSMPDFDRMRAMQRSLQQGLADWMSSAKKELQESPGPLIGPKFAYMSLGGSDGTFLEDMDHSQLMMKRRIKIDVNSKGMPETVRAERRERLIEEFLTYPSRRVLFFVGRVRMTVLGHNNEEYLTRAAEPGLDEPENVIAQALHDKMPSEKINRLMYKTVMNEIDWEKHPIDEDELWIMLRDGGALWLRMLRCFVFDLPGLLKNCGIPEIEKLAVSQEEKIRQLGVGGIRGLPFPSLDDDQKTELLTRVMVKPMFREALGDGIGAVLLQKLEDVMFKISYPTPPIKPSI